jgi:hypothetical protein
MARRCGPRCRPHGPAVIARVAGLALQVRLQFRLQAGHDAIASLRIALPQFDGHLVNDLPAEGQLVGHTGIALLQPMAGPRPIRVSVAGEDFVWRRELTG